MKKITKRSHYKKVMKVVAPVKNPVLLLPMDFPEIEEPIVILPSHISEEDLRTGWWAKAWKWILN